MTNADVIYGIIAIEVPLVELLGILTTVHAVMNILASIRNSVPGVIRMSKYFVPDLQILSALKLAALRGVDVRILDNPEMRRETLDGLVRERVLLSAADQMHLGVSDERLQRVFATDPQFAGLRNPDFVG